VDKPEGAAAKADNKKVSNKLQLHQIRTNLTEARLATHARLAPELGQQSNVV